MPAPRRNGWHKRSRARQALPVYGGSRSLKRRLPHSDESHAGLAELTAAFPMSGEELFQSLQQVQGVRRVAWRTWRGPAGQSF